MRTPRLSLRRLLLPAGLVTLMAFPSTASAVACDVLDEWDGGTPNALVDSGGKEWDVDDEGTVDDGTDDAYDDFGYLALRMEPSSDFEYFPEVYGTDPTSPYYRGECTMSADGREIHFPEVSDDAFGPLRLKRQFRVPATGVAYGRWVDTIRNTGSTPVTIDVRFDGDLGSDGGTEVLASGSGDAAFGPTDTWVASWDGEDRSTEPDDDPPLTHFFQSSNPRITHGLDAAELDYDDMSVEFHQVTVPPNGTIRFMFVAMQHQLRGEAIAAGARHAGETSLFFEGLTPAEASTVVNWYNDLDNDTVRDTADNCAAVVNSDQANLDGDPLGDACDPDVDGDNAADSADNCLRLSNADQANLDADGLGNACDPDVDGDGVGNGGDSCPDAAGTLANGCSPAPVAPVVPLVANFTGTSGRDVRLGNKLNNVFSLGAGNDTCRGMGGNDICRLGAGNDVCEGGVGNDRCFGEAGADRIDCGTGTDVANGGAGNDRIVCTGTGKDAADTVIGGPGRDTCIVNRNDKVKSCERVIRRK